MAFTDTTAGTSTHDPDDISLFLRQLLHRSSSSTTPPPPLPPSSSATLPSTFPPPPMAATHHHQVLPSISSLPPISTTRTHLHHIPPTLPSFPARISDDTLTGVVLSAPATAYLPAGGGSNLSSESLTGSGPLRSFENEYGGEDCDCESEEAPDTAADGAEMKHPPPRNQSKRSRAAEVHNLSEKRRRSRINEKMKALQNLIPNSNKTDKASMLDEAIEYLKQLQLQVQMLSMRNGLSLHPMCLPSVSGVLHPSELSQMGLDFSTRGGRSLDNTNPPNEVNIMQSTRSHAVFNPSKQCVSPTRPPLLPNVSSVMNPEPSISYSLDSCIQDNFGPFQLRNFPQFPAKRTIRALAMHEPETNHMYMGPSMNQNDASNEGKTLLPPSFETGGSDIKGKSPVEAQQTQHNYGLQEMLP